MGVCQGCNVIFWKNNYPLWIGSTPETVYLDVFERLIFSETFNFSTAINLDITLHGINGLARESVAALLNAAHPDVNYPLSVAQVIQELQASVDLGGDHIQEQLERFQTFNNLACPLIS